jgi:predicted transcriptional regulator of viral defense system
MNRNDVIATLERVATPQRGLFTRHQAQHHGINDMWLARLKDDAIEQVQHGVWTIADVVDRHRSVRTAILLIDVDGTSFVKSLRQPMCVVSHLSAAVMHGMCDQLPGKNRGPVVTTTRTISTTRRVQPIKGQLKPGEVVWIDGIPVTSAERTVADLSRAGFELGEFAALDERVSRLTGT